MKKIVLSLIVSFVACFATLVATRAYAQPVVTPQLGWCSADGQTCVGPSLAVTLTRITADGKVQAGINPGVCYGVTRSPETAYAFGVDGCLAFALNQAGLGTNVLSPAVLFKINKFRAGMSAEFTQTPGVGLSRVIGFAFGGGFDLQALTQFYAKTQVRDAVQADRAAQAAK